MDGSKVARVRLDRRARFLPHFDSLCDGADKVAARSVIKIVQLKAMTAVLSAGQFFMGATCNACTKKLDWLATQGGFNRDLVGAVLRMPNEQGYPVIVTFEVNEPLMRASHQVPRQVAFNEEVKILSSVNAGAFLWPLRYVCGDLQRERQYEPLLAFLRDPVMQLAFVQKNLDKRLNDTGGDYREMCVRYGKFIHHSRPQEFADKCVENVHKLLEAGHTEEE